ncbi:TRAP transporter substrate-binding protein [Acetobacteraceae bacterium H6797]|nr:TRAP transporter substrate-binding protein [Acetobacteraceae bacterium H6797]
MLLLPMLALASAAPAQEVLRPQVVGGLGGVAQYTEFEEPFWRDTVPKLTDGRVRPSIVSLDNNGIRGQDMLHLLRLNVIPFGTLLLSLVANDEPELGAPNIALLSSDIASQRRLVQAYRPHLAQILSERYDLELLAVYTYPAQVLFCRKPFEGLADIRGRRVRVSGATQADAVEALGGTAVVTPFSAMLDTMKRGLVDCVITGTLSGNEMGLGEVATHVHAMPISWGVSLFAASKRTWATFDPETRGVLTAGLADLEQKVWQAAERDTQEGLACNTGQGACRRGKPGRMVMVPASAADEALRQRMFERVTLNAWLRRCGPDCLDAWNGFLAAPAGLPPRKELD